MTWSTTNKTWSVGEIVTAAMMNQYIRDQLNQTPNAVITTAGDLVYAAGASSFSRLGVSGVATNAFLTYNGASAPQWFRPPLVVINISSTQTLTNGATTFVNFDVETADTGNGHSTSAGNSSKYTIPTAGTWHFGLYWAMDANSSGIRYSDLTVNGSVALRNAKNADSTGTQFHAFSYPCTQYSSGSTVTIGLYQNSGANFGLTICIFYGAWVGPG